MRGGRGGEDAFLADDELRHAVARREADDGLDGGLGEVAAVAADDERGVGGAGGDGGEDRLDKVLGVVLLRKDLDAVAGRERVSGERVWQAWAGGDSLCLPLAKTRGTGFWPSKGLV